MHNRILSLAARVERLEAAVKLAAIWFEEYAALHHAKGTADGNDKAERNLSRAKQLRAALENRDA